MEELNEKLERLLKPMDLPWNRKREFTPAKLKWLDKNLAKRNEKHKNYTEAKATIEKLIKQG